MVNTDGSASLNVTWKCRNVSHFKCHGGVCQRALVQPFGPKRTPSMLKRSSYTRDLRHPGSKSHFCVVSDNTGSYHIVHKLMSATQTECYIINKQACLHQTPPASIVAPWWPSAAFYVSVARRKVGSSPGHDGRFCYWQTGVVLSFIRCQSSQFFYSCLDIIEKLLVIKHFAALEDIYLICQSHNDRASNNLQTSF